MLVSVHSAPEELGTTAPGSGGQPSSEYADVIVLPWNDLDALERQFQHWYAELNRTLTTEDVIEVQRRLVELGYSPGVIDGIVGRNTRAAVRAFKRDYEYSTVDGQVDTLLLGDLRARTEATHVDH